MSHSEADKHPEIFGSPTAVVLALYAIRNPKGETTVVESTAEPAAQPVNLKLSKVRKGFAFSA